MFLNFDRVLAIHEDQLKAFGGSPGLRDRGMVESALGQPEASWRGEYLHPGLFEMASAYAFHLARNHPFLDGNKRTALASALIFLELNGLALRDPEGKLYEAMIRVALGKIDKAVLTKLLSGLSRSSRRGRDSDTRGGSGSRPEAGSGSSR